MNPQRPFSVEADIAGNVLRTHFRGVVRGKNFKVELDRMRDLLPKLSSGFVMCTDLTDLEEMDLDCIRPVGTMMDLARAAGVGKVVRVIPDPQKDIGFKLLSLTHYRGKVPVITCKTRADAEAEIRRA